jgi:hypothetical protein
MSSLLSLRVVVVIDGRKIWDVRSLWLEHGRVAECKL